MRTSPDGEIRRIVVGACQFDVRLKHAHSLERHPIPNVVVLVLLDQHARKQCDAGHVCILEVIGSGGFDPYFSST